MIKTTKLLTELQTALSADFITDKAPLRDYAGFDSQSIAAGQPRQTFSLVLSSVQIQSIREQITILYDQLIAKCWKEGEPLPFDMIRFDAFFDGETNSIKIIELNTRNVGMHEIVEWLDAVVGQQVGASKQYSLNQRFVENQMLLHEHICGSGQPLLYITAPVIPRWLYYEALVNNYKSVTVVTHQKDMNSSDSGVVFNGQTYQAVARKYAWPLSADVAKLDQADVIRVLQPLWMRSFGHKSFLQEFDSPALLASETYNPKHFARYQRDKDALVLKVIDSGNSKSVYIGASCSEKEWRSYLQTAAQKPHRWVLQEYISPTAHQIMMHGGPTLLARIQLGVFVLPSIHDPHDFDLDLVVKAYLGTDEQFKFDPSGLNPDIWFGHVIEHA